MPKMSPRVEEFYNHVHDTATGRFSNRAAGGRAAQGRAGWREGTPAEFPGKTKSRVLSATKAKDLRAYEARPRPHSLADVNAHVNSVWKKSTQGKGTATPENFPRGDKRKGPTHSTIKLKRGSTGKKLRNIRDQSGMQRFLTSRAAASRWQHRPRKGD